MKAYRFSAVFALAMFVGGACWFIVGVRSVRAGALGITRYNDTRVAEGPFPKTFVDPTGGVRILMHAPRRIVSLMLGADEILTTLAPPTSIAAVSRFADDQFISTCADRVPSAAFRIRGADPEHILVLEPDMVFAAAYTLETAVRIFVGSGIPVIRFGRYDSFDEVAANVRTVGAAVGEETKARALVETMWSRLRDVASRVQGLPKPRVLYYSPVGYTEGAHSLVDEKIVRAGGVNVVAQTGLTGPRHFSVDFLTSLDPEVIIVPRWAPGDTAAVELSKSAAWKDVAAVRHHRVHAVDAKWLTSVSPDGVRGVEEIAKRLHPEAFAQ